MSLKDYLEDNPTAFKILEMFYTENKPLVLNRVLGKNKGADRQVILYWFERLQKEKVIKLHHKKRFTKYYTITEKARNAVAEIKEGA